MNYLSTRGGDAGLSFQDAVLTGLARDGGLLLPESFPDLSGSLDELRALDYPSLAFEVMRPFADDIPDDDLRDIIRRSYGTFDTKEVTPLRRLGEVFVLELFHGPTLAFKDVALQFLGNLFEYVLGKRGGRLNIVAATSGDTGSAAIHGMRGRKNISITVLHPDGRVSPVQALQMTSVLDDNVHNLAIGGTFDDCQAIVKTLFSDLAFKERHSLGAVNSINWARILAQVVYYFFGAFRAMEATGAKDVSFTVPTGNFGDVFAGYVAYRMGLPMRRLVVATNENDILARCFNTGLYKRGEVAPTRSPSMDIQIASNFERYLYYFVGEDTAKVRQLMGLFRSTGEISLTDNGTPIDDPVFRAGRGDTADTLRMIRETWEGHSYLVDPHTAVGMAVAKGFLGDVPMICLSTAHPAKFGGAIKEAVGEDIARHPRIDALLGAPTRVERLPADAARVADYVAAHSI